MLSLTRAEIALFLAALATALVLRLHGLDADLNHDEAYTWQVFASQPYGEIVSSYPVPNNHILHSLLVRLSTQAFGTGEIAIRLPALLAGIVAIPAVFLLCRALFQLNAPGLLAAWMLALAPVHITFSQAARGYSLLVLSAILAFLCLQRAIQKGGSGYWVGFVCSSFASAYAVPSGVLHLAVLVAWAGVTQRANRRVLGRVALAGAAAGVLVAAAYWPIRHELMEAGAHWGRSLEGLALFELVRETVDLALGGVYGVPLLLCAIAGIARTRVGAPYVGLYAALAWSLPFLLAVPMGVAGQPRTYIFLLIPLILAAAFGALGLRSRRLRSIAVALLLGGHAWVAGAHLRVPANTSFSELSDLLATRSASAELIVVPSIVNMQVAHYAPQAISRGLVNALARRRIDDLLFLAKPGDPRFRLDNYLLRKNLVADADYQEALRFPPAIFEELYVSDRLELHRLARRGQLVLAPDPGSWKIAYLEERGEIELSAGEAAVSDLPGVRIANPGGIRFSLLSSESFTSPGKGLAVLLYARTEANRTSASLYEIEPDSDGLGVKTPLQMFRTNRSVPFRRGNGQVWYLDAYLLPVREGGRYGVYALTWEATRQQMADVACFLFPY